MDYILLEATKYVKRYKCPYCEQRLERDKLIKHIDKKHSELLQASWIFLLVFLRATGHRYGKVSKVSSYLSGTS